MRVRLQVGWPILKRWVVREHKARYRQSVLNILWALVTPLGLLAVYGVILTQSAQVTGEGLPYLTFAWAGLVVWQGFASAINGSVVSLVTASDVIGKVWFPREVIPLASTVAAGVDLGFGLATLLVLALVQGVVPTWTALLAVIPLATLAFWTAGLGIYLAIFNVFVRDVSHGVRLVLQIAFFATPVLYGVGFLADLAWLVRLNPIAAVIEGIRLSLLRGIAPVSQWTIGHLVAGAGVFASSLWYTRAVEHRIPDAL